MPTPAHFLAPLTADQRDQGFSSSRGRTERPSGEASAPSPFARARVRQALAAYRAVRFSIKTGVRAYFAEKEAAREAVFAAVSEARADRVSG